MACFVAVIENCLTHNYLTLNTDTNTLEFHKDQCSPNNFVIQEDPKIRELKLFHSDHYLAVGGNGFTVATSSSGLRVCTEPPNRSTGIMIYLQTSDGGVRHYLRDNTRERNRLEKVDQNYINDNGQNSGFLRQELEFNLVLVDTKDLQH